jgi:hypothetical protein
MKKIWGVMLFLGLLWTGCSDEPEAGALGSSILKLDHVWAQASQPFGLQTTLVHPITGDSLTFSKFDYYVSQIALVREDGSVWQEPESYHLVRTSEGVMSSLLLDSIPEGDYAGIRFLFGVDSARNVSGAQEGALAVSNQMFWSWSTGYIFLKAEGVTHRQPNGFAYHVGGFQGTHSAIRPIALSFGPSRLRVRSGGVPSVHCKVDVSQIWNADFNTAGQSTFHMPSPTTSGIATRFSSAFQFDHLHN